MKLQNSKFKIFKTLLLLGVVCFLFGLWFLVSEVYFSQAQKVGEIKFEVKQGESVTKLADRLKNEGVIRSAWFFKKYLSLTSVDKKVNIGEFVVQAPITLKRVADALSQLGLNEDAITVIPGWTIRDVAIYFSAQGGPALGGEVRFSSQDFFDVVGLPAVNYKLSSIQAPKIDLDLRILQDKPWYVSYEGYLAPETYRVYKNADVKDVVAKLLRERENQITDEMWNDIEKSGRSFFEILTMASILEQEVRSDDDRRMVADIFWRRYDINWALQADSTVHYAVNKSGNVFTTAEDRDTNSPWNTYKYPGLPMGPICNPSLDSIEATIYSEKNKYNYFLTDKDGVVHYAKTLEEHNENRVKYL